MNRRGFLGAILASCAAPAIVRAGSIMRVRAIVLPGEGEFAAVVARNSLISPSMVIRESLRMLQDNLTFAEAMNRQYDAELPSAIGTIRFRRPGLVRSS